ncbi:MAG: sulfatase-like hydrolase/transferase, partial [Candidatus Gastranaerophilales bacterium]|nr:sulfatase-like hydrolase/transferase [Candidatus Gastranaerophilales bacterium]
MKDWLIYLTFLFTFFVFAPLNTYLNNILEVNCETFIFSCALFLFVVFGIIFFAVKKFANEKFLKIFNSIILFLTILIFIEGNLINYGFGVIDGSAIKWNKYILPIIAETIVWIAFGFLLFKYNKKIFDKTKEICLFILVFQLINSAFGAINVLNEKTIASKKQLYSENNKKPENNYYTFSNKDNVLIIVLDAFPIDLLDDVFKLKEGEKIKKELKDFTYYHNSIGRFPTTLMSVPFIQSGIPYDNTITMNEYKEKNKEYFIQNKLNDRLYFNGSNPYSNAGEVNFCYTVVFKYSPILAKMFLNKQVNLVNYELSGYETHYFNHLKREINFTNKPVYKYLHLVGVHPGARMNKNITYNPKASLIDTAIGNLKIVSYILDKLKGQKVYDNSMIFIIADHGLSTSLYNRKYSKPIFLFKNYNTSQNEMTVNNSFVSLGDIPNTIFDVQKKKLNPYGISILKDIPKDRIIQFCGYEWSKYAREKAGAKNYLPPLECANFKNGNKYIYDEKDSYINEQKKVFSSDIEKELYSEFYYIAEDKSVL